VQTHGPRFETAAEIRQVAGFADVVGMTCAHEATLCKELALPYALVCVVDNMANGKLLIDTKTTPSQPTFTLYTQFVRCVERRVEYGAVP